MPSERALTFALMGVLLAIPVAVGVYVISVNASNEHTISELQRARDEVHGVLAAQDGLMTIPYTDTENGCPDTTVSGEPDPNVHRTYRYGAATPASQLPSTVVSALGASGWSASSAPITRATPEGTRAVGTEMTKVFTDVVVRVEIFQAQPFGEEQLHVVVVTTC